MVVYVSVGDLYVIEIVAAIIALPRTVRKAVVLFIRVMAYMSPAYRCNADRAYVLRIVICMARQGSPHDSAQAKIKFCIYNYKTL